MEYDFWEQIYRGATQFEAAEAAGVSAQTGQRWVRVSGGIRPRLVVVIGRDPATRGRALSEFEREHIGLRRGHVGVRQIARELARQPSTISRELRRHRAYDRRTHRCGYYSPLLAQSRADQNRRRPRPEGWRSARRWPPRSRLGWSSGGARGRSPPGCAPTIPTIRRCR